MSGPIVRKYGFPNHEKIFGSRPIEHGVDEAEEGGPSAEPPAPAVAAEDQKKPAPAPNAAAKAKSPARPKGAKKG